MKNSFIIIAIIFISCGKKENINPVQQDKLYDVSIVSSTKQDSVTIETVQDDNTIANLYKAGDSTILLYYQLRESTYGYVKTDSIRVPYNIVGCAPITLLFVKDSANRDMLYYSFHNDINYIENFTKGKTESVRNCYLQTFNTDLFSTRIFNFPLDYTTVENCYFTVNDISYLSTYNNEMYYHISICANWTNKDKKYSIDILAILMIQ